MNRINISLTDYMAVLDLRETGSFRAAAQKLQLSPSALSRQISSLEIKLGTRLFDRDTRNIRLTASGEVFARIAERMVNAAKDAQTEFNAHLSARQGQLTIAGLPSLTVAILPKILCRYTSLYPKIDLKVIDALSDKVIEAVETGQAEIGLTAGTVSTRSKLDFQPLLEDAFVAIGSPDGPLQEDRDYEWSELVEMPFIATALGTSVRELIDGACLSLNRPLTPRFEVAHLATAGAFVAQGLGVTVLPKLTLAILPKERLIQRKLNGFVLRRRIGLVQKSGRFPSPAATSFMNVLSEFSLKSGHVSLKT
jgi:DNA-binding transcriptional LysR family regulator